MSLVTTGVLYTDTVVTFQAQLVPADATPPYTYAIDGGAEMSADLTAWTFIRTFATAGAHEVGLAVRNCDMTQPVTAATQVQVLPRPDGPPDFDIYMPLMLRSQ